MTADFTTVTELPNSMASREQLARLYQRYWLARQRAAGKRVLEVACGAGLGLGYLADGAQQLAGGDCTLPLLAAAQSHYQGRVPLLGLDAQRLPFADGAFDLVIVFEAIYYFPDVERFIHETRRVLSAGGSLLIGSVNREWPDFAPSPFSHHYYSLTELHALLSQHGFTQVESWVAFPAQPTSLLHRALSLARRVAITLHLMPRTLTGRARLKRLVYGRLLPVPAEVTEEMTSLFPGEWLRLEPAVPGRPNTRYKIFYCVARRS